MQIAYEKKKKQIFHSMNGQMHKYYDESESDYHIATS